MHNLEEKYLADLISSVSTNDRVRIVQNIVRKAPEFGVCRQLGESVFKYFVLRDAEEMYLIASTLLRKILDSERMSYTLLSNMQRDLKLRVRKESKDLAEIPLKQSQAYVSMVRERERPH
jgi:hypothetical protein